MIYIIIKLCFSYSTGKSELAFVVNTPPDMTKMVVDLDPPIGNALETYFKITCHNVLDDDYPIRYSFGYSLLIDKPNRLLRKSDCTWVLLSEILYYITFTYSIITICLQDNNVNSICMYYIKLKFTFPVY